MDRLRDAAAGGRPLIQEALAAYPRGHGFREEVSVGKLPLRVDILLIEPGIFRLADFRFATYLVETDVMAERGEAILSLVSRAFLNRRERIMEQLTRTGHTALLLYMLQQVQQFRSLGEDFAMQHKDSEYLGEVEQELLTAVLEGVPEDRLNTLLKSIPVEKRLRGLSSEERLRGLPLEEVAVGLSEEQAARLRELLERRRDR